MNSNTVRRVKAIVARQIQNLQEQSECREGAEIDWYSEVSREVEAPRSDVKTVILKLFHSLAPPYVTLRLLAWMRGEPLASCSPIQPHCIEHVEVMRLACYCGATIEVEGFKGVSQKKLTHELRRRARFEEWEGLDGDAVCKSCSDLYGWTSETWR